MSFELQAQKTGSFCLFDINRTQSVNTNVTLPRNNFTEFHSSQIDQAYHHNHQNILKLCQQLRRENYQLRTRNKQLLYRLQQLQKQSSDMNTDLLTKNRKDKILQLTNKNRQSLQIQFKGYKRSAYDGYKKKIQQYKAYIEYVFKCYKEYTLTNDKKYKHTLQKLCTSKKKDIMSKIQQIKALNEEDNSHFSHQLNNSQECTLQDIDKVHAPVLRKKICQLVNITSSLTNSYKEEICNIRKDVNGRNQKLVNELKKCIKKNINIENKESNKQNKHTQHNTSKTKNNNNHNNSNSNSNGNVQNSTVQIKRRISMGHPPLPNTSINTINTSFNVKSFSRTVTPKNKSSLSNFNNKSGSKKKK